MSTGCQNVKGRQSDRETESGLLTTIPFSHFWEQNFQPIPNVRKLNSINFQCQMGNFFPTNYQWGEIKLETGNLLIFIKQNTF